MSRRGDMPLGCALLVLAVLASGAIGWVMNLVAFCQCDFESPYKSEIIRGVGIPVPVVGAVAGYLTIGEEVEDD